MTGPAANPAGQQSVVDPYFIQTLEATAAGGVAAATIRTSRLVVLTQDPSAPLGLAVPVSDTGDLTVYGDVVRVYGRVVAPRCSIKIVCRRLEFHPSSAGISEIDVSARKGANGAPGSALQAATGGDGQGSSAADAAGKPGTSGADGADGADGAEGGTILIYCGTLACLAQVWLKSRGGEGGDGAAGQQGGVGGKGWSGFRLKDFVGAAHGGAGGCGGNGGNSGRGGKGGTIKVYFTNMERQANCGLVTDVTGGDGGSGGRPGPGGRGGDGGTPEAGASYTDTSGFPPVDTRLNGADSGGGGICGIPGYGGPPGAFGDLTWGWPLNIYSPQTDEDRRLYSICVGSLSTTTPGPGSPKTGKDGEAPQNPDECAAAGTPGNAARYVFVYGTPGAGPGSDGHVGQPNRTRTPKSPRLSPVGGAGHQYAQLQIGLGDVAAQADAEQLDMLFDHVRTRYLLTNIESSSTIATDLMMPLQWLVAIADAKGDKDLSTSAAATLHTLVSRCNIFGRDAQYAALGSLTEYQEALKAALPLFAEVQSACVQLSAAVNDATQRKAFLDNVLTQQDALLDKLETDEKDNQKSLETTAAQIRALDTSRLDVAKKLGDAFDQLSDRIRTAIGLSASDFFGLFNQLSFTNRELTNKAGELMAGGVAAAGAMLLSQAGDLTTKAMDNVTTDTGQSLNKNFVIRRMEYLNKDIKTIGGLKEARDGLIKTDPNAEYRLQTTRDQVESICSNFYQSYPEAKTISSTLDDYIDAVAARNEKVEEYNQLLSDLCYMKAEAAKLKTQKAQTNAALLAAASPGLPAMAKFTAALYRHARERCIELLYTASRVYTMQTLDLYDVFSDVLGRLTSAGCSDLNTAALDTGLIDLIGQHLKQKQARKTSVEPFVPDGDRSSITLTPKNNPLLFTMLASHQPGVFSILPPTPDTTVERNPFAAMADVRLSHIRCTAVGMRTSDDVHVIKITHPGIETLVTEDGRRVRVHHNDVTAQCTYKATTGVFTGDGALDADHTMIGPFCQWILEIPGAANRSLDLTGLTSIKVEFQGTYRAFVPAGGA